ncbi:MAG TPA: ferritin-like domain-containing protein [Acidimicrobiia bacterium]|nr:ferritin-like domain-containing protein [Acidimicrobiia bacterium]
MTRRDHDPIEISEHELADLTSDLDEIHRDTLPRFRESLDEWRGTPSRRAFLVGGGAALGGVALAASGLTGLTAAAARTRTAAGAPATRAGKKAPRLSGDLAVVALAASLENLAVATYQAGIDAATAGRLGAVPPAVVTFATTAQSQHREHAAAWNAILTSAKKPAVTGVDLTVKREVDAAFADVKDVGGLAKLALTLENGAAATYLEAINVVKAPAGIKTAATIHPVELQHAAILNFVLGQYPVPDSFAKTDEARTVRDRIG